MTQDNLVNEIYDKAVKLETGLHKLNTASLNLVRSALCTDGAHHKQWYLEQLHALLTTDPLPEHEEGIAP